VRIIGEPKTDAQNRITQASWDVQQFMNTPWALDPHSRWEVALTELTLPKTFQMYPDRINPLIFMITTHDEEELHRFTLSKNTFYHSPDELVEYMNTLMEDTEAIEFAMEDTEAIDISSETVSDSTSDSASASADSSSQASPIKFKVYDCLQFNYDSHSLRVFLRIKQRPPVDIYISFSSGLTELLNLKEDEFEIKSENDERQFQRVVFSEIINFSILTDYIHIMLQEANMSFINNKMVPWIYSSSIASSNEVSHSHTHITIKPTNLCYVPLNHVNSMRNILNLSVVDNDMNPLNPHELLYKHNTTVFHLHFRNILPGR